MSKNKNPTELVSELRNAFNSGKTKPIGYRIKQLNALKRLLEENKDEITQALADDLHKCKIESLLMEVNFLICEIEYVLMHIREWSKPEKPPTTIANILDSVYILHEPFGVVLVMGAWNYPLLLTLSPVIGAIAAGNCVVIKPSELSPATSKFIEKSIPKYLDADSFQVYEGGIPETTELLKEKFDYIFYTGSTTVGKIIQAAAAKHLTPTTLELGGKSPVYLDSTADIEISAKRIIWGKCVNAGQTCIAPDYLLCPKSLQDKFVTACKKALKELFGEDPKSSPDYGRILNERHVQRLSTLIEGNVVAHGGEVDFADKYIAPTILINVDPSSPIMQEEIFGPILPIISIEDAYDAIKFINSREKPLALYIFSNRKRDIEQILLNTPAGGVTVNDTIMHLTVHSLPFGGVGNSGMGHYHGKYSYDTFTHKKGVLHKNLGLIGETLSCPRYPPYTQANLTYLRILLAPGLSLPKKYLTHLMCFGLGVAFFYIVKFIQSSLIEQ
nr:aldehyde dehydrogenase, dimeric NADP-preferring-like [Leptinotarsa decemlineata]